MRSMKTLIRLTAALSLILGFSAPAQQVDLRTGSVARTVAKLRAGQFVWAPEAAPAGPMMLIINLATQRGILFRNGVPIAATTVSTGSAGRETPTGVFTILEKQVEHRSRTYDNAPMPYMQRLTWRGVSIHAGKLPGYPASHGCIRLPAAFAKLLFATTRLGMTVVITDHAVTPRIAPTPEVVLRSAPSSKASNAPVEWFPERSADGPVSIIVSAADKRATVLRNGIVIGSGTVTIDGPVTGSWVYTLRNVDEQGQHWLRVSLLSSRSPASEHVPPQEWQRYHAPEALKRAVATIVRPGTTIIVTPDSVQPGGDAADIIDAETPAEK
jgi:hypothetical protein